MKKWIAWADVKVGHKMITVKNETNFLFALISIFFWSFSNFTVGVGMTLKNKSGYIHGK